MRFKEQDRWLIAVIGLWILAVFIIWPHRLVSERHDDPDPLECQALKVWFDVYNERYFMGMLPKNTVVEYGNAGGAMAATTKVGGVFHITLERRYTLAERVSHEILLHEGCHIISWSEKEEHGSRWHDCMHRLEEQGAFESLW